MKNKSNKINGLNFLLKVNDYERGSGHLQRNLAGGRKRMREGESICKPGSVEDSHSSTTLIAERL